MSDLSRYSQGGVALHQIMIQSKQETEPIKVLIVDDHPVVRKGLHNALARDKNLLVVGEAADGQEALAKAKKLSPQVVLMDIDLPKLDGLTVAEKFSKQKRASKAVLLFSQSSKQYKRILQSGARGYLSKSAPAAEFVQAIKTVAAGGSFFSEDFERAALQDSTHSKALRQLLNPRERQVLSGIAAGLSNKDIGSRLRVSVRTVETHRESIKRKLSIQSTAGLTRFALKHGLHFS